MSCVHDDDRIGLGFVVCDASRRKHRLNQALDLLDVSRSQVAKLIMPLLCRQPIELLIVQGINRVPLGVEGQPILKGQLFHLLQWISAVEMTTHVEIRSGDTDVMKVLFLGTLGQHLKDVVDRSITNQVFTITFIDLPGAVTRNADLPVALLRRRRRREFRKILSNRRYRRWRSGSCNRHHLRNWLHRVNRRVSQPRSSRIERRWPDNRKGLNWFIGEHLLGHLLTKSNSGTEQQKVKQKIVIFHGVFLMDLELPTATEEENLIQFAEAQPRSSFEV